MTSPEERKLWQDAYAGAGDAEAIRRRTIDLYAAGEDPWQIAGEIGRFEATNQAILARFGRVGHLLEIGCGEGYQTAYLARVGTRVTGCDISGDALERARQRVPAARFHVAAVPQLALPAEAGPYDLAVACEVLYFADDIGAAIARMRALAPMGLLSALERKWRRFAVALAGVPAVEITRHAEAQNCWLIATWDDRR
jgi:SAM-dependent methyltransferase